MLEKGKDGGARGAAGDLGQPAWLVPDSLSPPPRRNGILRTNGVM
jgi:hypothetical protein